MSVIPRRIEDAGQWRCDCCKREHVGCPPPDDNICDDCYNDCLPGCCGVTGEVRGLS